MGEPPRKLSVGIIGFGRIGAEHAGWIEASRSLHVGSVYDATWPRAALAAARGFSVARLPGMLLEDKSIDVALIATPTSMHFEHARAAISAGKHVMVEKPVTLDARSAVELKSLADARGVKLCVFHCRRWDSDFLTVKRAIEQNTFGRVFNVESRLGQWSSCVGPAAKEYHPNWRNERAFGGGGLFDWGSHFVDQLWQLMLPAQPQRVFAQLRSNVWSRDCDDFARVLIDFDNGATGLCEINTTTTRPLPRWQIDGQLGSASSPFSLAFDTNEWTKLAFTRAIDGETIAISKAPRGLSETQIWDAFADSILTDTEPPVSIQSVITTMKLLDAARESSESGKVVEVISD
jgi:predicted dehydrogenase